MAVDPTGTDAFNPQDPNDRYRPGKPAKSPQQPPATTSTPTPSPGGTGVMDVVADIFEWLDNLDSSYAKCMAQCFILEMTDEDIDSLIEELRSDPQIGSYMDNIAAELIRRGVAWPGARISQLASIIKIIQGRGFAGGIVVTKGTRGLGIEVARNKVVHKIRQLLTKKLGRAAGQIGGRLTGAMSGVGLAALGVDACIAKDCHDAYIGDGQYHDDEVPFLDDFFFPHGIPYRGPFRPGEPGYKAPMTQPSPPATGVPSNGGTPEREAATQCCGDQADDGE